MGQPGSNAKIDELHRLRLRVHHDVVWIRVRVYDVLLMNFAEGRGKLGSDLEALFEREWMIGPYNP